MGCHGMLLRDIALLLLDQNWTKQLPDPASAGQWIRPLPQRHPQ